MWAEMVRGLGCAGGVIHYKELTAGKLAAALKQTLNNKALYARAAEIGEKIRAEQGVSRARVLIEELLQRIAGTSSLTSVFAQQNQSASERRKLQRQIRMRGKSGRHLETSDSEASGFSLN